MNHRPSTLSIVEPAPLPAGRKDKFRGVDPDRLDRFGAALDRVLADIFALAVDDKPIRGEGARKLAILSRLISVLARNFEREVERAL